MNDLYNDQNYDSEPNYDGGGWFGSRSKGKSRSRNFDAMSDMGLGNVDDVMKTGIDEGMKVCRKVRWALRGVMAGLILFVIIIIALYAFTGATSCLGIGGHLLVGSTVIMLVAVVCGIFAALFMIPSCDTIKDTADDMIRNVGTAVKGLEYQLKTKKQLLSANAEYI
jgi:hypothetical protein